MIGADQIQSHATGAQREEEHQRRGGSGGEAAGGRGEAGRGGGRCGIECFHDFAASFRVRVTLIYEIRL